MLTVFGVQLGWVGIFLFMVGVLAVAGLLGWLFRFIVGSMFLLGLLWIMDGAPLKRWHGLRIIRRGK